MNTIKHILVTVVAAVAMSTAVVGCKTKMNPNTAVWAGMAFHQAYTKIAETQDEQFKKDVEELWAAIDKVETVEGLGEVYTLVANKIDALLQDKGLNEKQLKVIKVFRKLIDKAVARALSDKSEKQERAILWLTKFRDGIRTMRKLDDGEDAVIPCDDCCDGDCEITPEEMKLLANALK